jgi:hypothetical protein
MREHKEVSVEQEQEGKFIECSQNMLGHTQGDREGGTERTEFKNKS